MAILSMKQSLSWPIELDYQFGNWGRKPHAELSWPAFRVNQFDFPFFDSLKFCRQTMFTMQAALYYTVTRYILFGIHFFIVSIQIGQRLVIPSAGQTFAKIQNRQIDVPTYISRQNHTAADVFLNYLRYFTLIKSPPFSDMRPIGEGLIKRKVFAGAHTI